MSRSATVREARSPRDRAAFLAFPFRHYAGDPLWVPPLRSSLKAEFDPARNPFLAHCDHALFLLERAGKVQGRIAALTDRLALEAWGGGHRDVRILRVRGG